MLPAPEEPVASPWEDIDDSDLRDRLLALLREDDRSLLLVDGRSGSSRSTFAERLRRLVGGTVVHTDDIALHHHRMVDWSTVLVDGVITPWRRGEAVSFRPPGWVARDRPGAVDVPTTARSTSRAWAPRGRTSRPWPTSRSGCNRTPTWPGDEACSEMSSWGAPKGSGAFWRHWMSAEEPFLAADRPWTRAAIIVNGTPVGGVPGRPLLAPGPLGG